MLTLKEFVLERETPEWSFMLTFAVPLAPSVLKDFEVDIKKSYHVTDFFGFPDLVKLQNKQIDISTFTKGSEALSNGLMTSGNVLVQLSGKSSFGLDIDFYSKIDRNGRRWYAPRHYPTYLRLQFKDKLLPKLMKKFPQLADIKKGISNSAFDKLMPSGKDKRAFIKFYYTEAKKLLTKKFIGDLSGVIRASARNNSKLDHDEILLHKFKIDKVWANSEDPDEVDIITSAIKKSGFKLSGVVSKSDIKNLGK